MATALGDIFVRIGLDGKDFESGLSKIQSASTKVFAGISAAIGGISYIGAGFEKEITKVGALTGATGETFENLGRVARSVAGETEFTASQAAEGMSFFAMAGFTAEQSMAALRPATMLATTGFTDLARSADIVTNVMSGFGMGFDQLSHSVDVLVATATSSNTTVSMLGESMSYMAPVAKAFGISIEETAAAIGLLGDAGIQGSRAGTNLRMAVVRLSKPTGEAAELLRQLGITTLDAQGKMRPLSEIFGKLAEKGATAQDMLTLFGPRAAAAAMVLTESMKSGEKSLDDFTKQLENADGKSEEVFKRMSETVSFQSNVLKSNLEGVALSIYDSLKPALMSLIKLAQKIALAFQNMDPDKLKLITNISLLTAGLSALGIAISTVGKAFLISFAPMNLVIMAIIASVAAIAVAILVVIDKWDELKKRIEDTEVWGFVEFLTGTDAVTRDRNLLKENIAQNEIGLMDTHRTQLAGSMPQQKGIFEEIMDSASSGFTKALDGLGLSTDNTATEVDLYSKEMGKAKGEMKYFSDAVQTTTKKIKEQTIEFDFDEMEKEVLAAEKKRQDAITRSAERADSLMNSHLDDVTNYQIALDQKFQQEEKQREDMLGSLSEIGSALGMATANFLNIASEAGPIGRGFDTVFQKMGKVGSLITSFAQGFSQGGIVGAILAIVFEVLISLKSIMKVFDLMNEGLGWIFDAISPLFDVLTNLSEWGNVVLKDLTGMLGQWIGAIGDVLEPIAGLISALLGPIIELIHNWLRGIIGLLAPLLQLLGAIGNVVNAVIGGFLELVQVVSPLSWALKGLAELGRLASEGIKGALDWFETAIEDIGKGFKTAERWIMQNIFQQKEQVTANIATLLAIKERNKQMLAEIETRNRMLTTLNSYNSTIHDFIEKLKQDMVLRDLTPEQIAKTFNEEVTDAFTIDDTVAVMVEMYKQLTDAGLSYSEAITRIAQGVDASSANVMGALMILPGAVIGASEAAETAAEEVSGFGEAVAEATESLTNVPSGFKLVQKRLQAISDNFEAVQVAQPSPVHVPEDKLMRASNSSVLNINSVTVQADDPKVFMQKMEALKQQQNINTYGTSIGPSYGIAGNG